MNKKLCVVDSVRQESGKRGEKANKQTQTGSCRASDRYFPFIFKVENQSNGIPGR